MASTYYILKAGIAPPDLSQQPEQIRLMFWGWVTELGLKVKDRELSRGLNARGKPLPPVSGRTRRHRRSAMTASGRGDRNAPYLMPGRGLSRTRSLLTGKPHLDHAEFWWRYDAHTGDGWGTILSYHAKRGEAYDVIGLSPRGVSAVAQQARQRWRLWKAGDVPATRPRPVHTPPVTSKVVGRTDLQNYTFGIGAGRAEVEQAMAEGRFSGFMSADEWRRHWRAKAPTPRLASPSTTAYSVRNGQSNVLLQHVWGEYRPKGATIRMGATKLDRAVNTLLDTIMQMPDLSPQQLAAVLGDGETFDRAVGEAIRRGRLVIVKEAGRITLRVVG